jgi:hypothetical protein
VYTRILISAAFFFVLSVPGWAQTDCSGEGNVVTCSFSKATNSAPAVTTGVYEFGSDGRLVVQFDTVLNDFTLTVTAVEVAAITNFDTSEFPADTVCVKYFGNGNQCVHYDFTGNSSGPNMVPVKNVDYKGLITLTLSYITSQTVNTPAFGHAPGDNAGAIYTENILTSYSAAPFCIECDPTMGGKVPNLSSVAAFDEPIHNASNFCGIAPPVFTQNPQGQKAQVEVNFKIVAGSDCGATGQRDKTATLSVSTTDNDGNIVFPPLKNVEGNKFHWNSKGGLNEYDISLDGLTTDQTYTITIFSNKFSPQTATFVAH